MCHDEAGTTQNRKQEVLPKHNFRCSGDMVPKAAHCSNFSRMAVLPAAQGEGVWGSVSFLRNDAVEAGLRNVACVQENAETLISKVRVLRIMLPSISVDYFKRSFPETGKIPPLFHIPNPSKFFRIFLASAAAS